MGKDNTHTAPTDLKKTVGTVAKRFLGFNQQDTQEFLRFLIDGIHEDVNRVQKHPKYVTIEEHDGMLVVLKVASLSGSGCFISSC